MRFLHALLSPFLPPTMRLMMKAGRLAEQGQHEAAIRLFEEKIGIDQADRKQLDVLRMKIEHWLAVQGRDDQSMMFLAQYASSLGLIRAYTPALGVLEAAMGLEQEDLQDAWNLATKLDIFWQDLDVNTRFMLWVGLHGVLSIVGRTSEAMDIFKYDLGILDFTLSDKLGSNREEIKDIVVLKLSSLQKDVAAAYLTFVFPLFETLGLRKEGLVLFEELLGLTAADYDSHRMLSQKMNKWVDSLQNPLTGKFAMIGLAGSLYQADEPRKALILLEAFANITPDDYASVEILGRKWKRFANQLPADTAATYFRMLISMLETVRRNPSLEISALLQADSDLRETDFEVYDRVGEKLSNRLALLQEDTKGAYIFSLAEIMDSVGMHRGAATVLEWFMDHHANFKAIPDDGDPAIVHIIAVLSNWFRFFYQNPDEKVLDYCRQTMKYLRAGFGTQGIRLEDRKSFIRYISLLKTAVLNTGFFQMDLQDAPEKKASLATEILLWDAELSQRILAERFLLEHRILLPADATITPGKWPFDTQLPVPADTKGAEQIPLLSSPAALTDESADLSAPDPLLMRYLQDEQNATAEVDEELARTLRALINAPLQLDTLALALGTNVMVLRAAFQDDGCLVWLAFECDGNGIKFVKKHTGNQTDKANITEWVNAFDRGIKDYWLAKENDPSYLTKFTQRHLKQLAELLQIDLLDPYINDNLHIVIQTDDVLGTVPFSYLPISGKPLFTRVASIGQSISLLLQTLQQRTKSDLATDTAEIQKIAVTSWFNPSESVYIRTAEQYLHAECVKLANQYDLQYFALAEEPPCSIESVAGLIQHQKKIGLLAVMGHGHARRPGIQMKNSELWYGNGCDLGGVDLVLMVSCSIGRMQSDRNNLDVDGFCIQLAVNRAFSVIACRWQIDAWQACLFANEIARQYLTINHHRENHNASFVKARALNEARKVFWQSTGDTYLNTLAAFEFYGLG